jgi:hypothetical protein
MSSKDPRLTELFEALRKRLAPAKLVEVDHWPDDPEAIGIAPQDRPGFLAYIAIDDRDDVQFFVSLEYPAGDDPADQPYMPAGDRNVGGVEDVCELVAGHFGGNAS